MSLENVKKFNDTLKKDLELDKQLAQFLSQVTTEQQRLKKVVEFAKKHGFELTESELSNYYGLNQDKTPLIEKDVPKKDTLFSNDTYNKDFLNQNSEITSRDDAKPKLNLEINRFFVWLSGASPEILVTCPHSEQMKHAALGMTVLIPVLSASIASLFILHKLNSPIYFMLPIAAVWALIILIMDRSLLATYRAYLPFHRRITQFIFRFLIALLIGLTIAHPLNLMLFHVEINREIETKKSEDIIKIENARKELDNQKFQGKNFTTRLDGVEQRIQEITSRQPPVCQFGSMSILGQTGTNSQLASYQDEQRQLESKLEAQRKNLEKWSHLIEAEKAGRKYTVEINGQNYETSGKSKCGQQCRGYETSKETENNALKTTEKRLEALSKLMIEETDRMQKDRVIQANVLREQATQNQQRCIEAQKLDEAQRAIDLQIVKDDQKSIVAEQREHQQKVHEINTRGSDILTQTEALHQLIKKSEAYWYLLANYVGWALLFFLIDTLPIILKFSSTGTYDKLVQAREAVYDEDYRKKYTEFEKSVQLEKERLNAESEKFRSRDEMLQVFLERMKQLDADFLTDERRERSIIADLKDPLSQKLKEDVLSEKIKLHHQYQLTMMRKFYAHIA